MKFVENIQALASAHDRNEALLVTLSSIPSARSLWETLSAEHEIAGTCLKESIAITETRKVATKTNHSKDRQHAIDICEMERLEYELHISDLQDIASIAQVDLEGI